MREDPNKITVTYGLLMVSQCLDFFVTSCTALEINYEKESVTGCPFPSLLYVWEVDRQTIKE